MSTVLTHAGLEHDYPRRVLRSVWEKAAPKLDISPTAHKYICEIIELTSNQDYKPDSICATFYGVAKLSQKIRMPRRSINRAEAELAETDWIIKTCSKRGRRNGVRDNHGAKQIRWAAGINIGPLIDRFQELQGLAEDVEIERLAQQACRDEINAIRRDIIEAGFEAEAVKAYPRGRPSELTCLAKLNVVLAALRDVMKTVLGYVSRPICPTGSAKTIRPNTIQETKIYDCTEPEILGVSDQIKNLSSFKLIATDAMKDAIEYCGQWNDYLSSVSMACEARCEEIGIPNKQWRITETKFGIPTAALFVAIIDRNWQRSERDPYRAENPRKCLSGMTWSYAKGELNLTGMLKGTAKPDTNPCCQDEVSKVTLVATPPHLVREGMLRSFPSTPTKPSGVDTQFFRGEYHE